MDLSDVDEIRFRRAKCYSLPPVVGKGEGGKDTNMLSFLV